jgi:iron(III) transport system substrate-binding protein
MQFTNTIKVIAAYVLATGTSSLFAQQNTVNAICSTDQAWCEQAAQEYTRATGAKGG